MKKFIEITDVKEKSITLRDGENSTLYLIQTPGVEYSTFDWALAEVARKNIGKTVAADVTNKRIVGRSGVAKIYWNLLDLFPGDEPPPKETNQSPDWDRIALGKILTHLVGSYLAQSGSIPTEEQFESLVRLAKRIRDVE